MIGKNHNYQGVNHTTPRIDSHAHFDEIYDTGIQEIMRQEGVSVISWAYISKPPVTLTGIKEYFEKQQERCDRGRKYGISIYRLIGIHPRSIPKVYTQVKDINASEITTLLENAYQPKDVVGIGETGLETINDVEKRIFEIHLELAQKKNLPVCIHTPRSNKTKITEIILSILDNYKLPANHILIDHIVDTNILAKVLDRGYYAGITLSNSKSSIAEAVAMIQKHKKNVSRIMINSDVVTNDPDEYKVFLDIKKHLNIETEHVLEKTARRFYNLPLLSKKVK